MTSGAVTSIVAGMGFYDNWVLPRFLNFAMGMKFVTEERKKCLAGVTGTVLEVGFGSGHNLPYYPTAVRKLVGVDPSKQSAKLARKRIANARFPVEYTALEGEALDAPDASFDSVVCTFTLCSVRDPAAALGQALRVLKPGGRFYFVEHGRSPDPKVQRWQDRMNGVQKAVLGGCHLNRDVERMLREAGFAFDELDSYYLKGQPKMSGFLTRGVARRADAPPA
jgi:ubiquinone/menaquinone biosynthesis C-methylase UbiE